MNFDQTIITVLCATILLGMVLYCASPTLFWIAAAIWAFCWVANCRN